MAATNDDDNFQLVVRRHRCLLCAGRHTSAACTVPVNWTLQLHERREIWSSDVQRVAVEVAVRAQLLSLRQSRGVTDHVRSIDVVQGTHDSTFTGVDRQGLCADFPHFNVAVRCDGGRARTVHIYHTPWNRQEGITVVVATVGTRADNIDALRAAFAPHGIFLRGDRDELLFSG
ncbi:hypothetical protein FN846DRAFT_915054 [Sphaerosporella brunnea]|uniref:Uncharacterized protein n=1 Tax=Sphaerosporella brunnea TaxID=1250544 RepID=A0A5J5EBT8_9PEZI|nr:hypothetical protein FN846DRAFT_915054 [Sphaerosporella brunnea]